MNTCMYSHLAALIYINMMISLWNGYCRAWWKCVLVRRSIKGGHDWPQRLLPNPNQCRMYESWIYLTLKCVHTRSMVCMIHRMWPIGHMCRCHSFITCMLSIIESAHDMYTNPNDSMCTMGRWIHACIHISLRLFAPLWWFHYEMCTTVHDGSVLWLGDPSREVMTDLKGYSQTHINVECMNYGLLSP